MNDRIFEPLLNAEKGETLEGYVRQGGYASLRKALEMSPGDIVEEVKNSNLRGRGGAGFPTGQKWTFLPPPDGKARYLVANADEGEPGTFKDRYILTRVPHLLLEGMIITAYALGLTKGYIFLRGEYTEGREMVERVIAEAADAGFLGKNILESAFSFDVAVHSGAGAYICGEETALLESLEGKRGHPRLKPPFPASSGLYGRPTLINNVETLACIPSIVLEGGFWFASLGSQKNGGTRLFALSGRVVKPGLYELPLGTNLKELIFTCGGGIPKNRRLKGVIPGGLSAPILIEEECDIPMDFDSLARAGSMLGSGAVMVFDEEDSILRILSSTVEFYSHESCGQCTPCRDGTNVLKKLMERILSETGREEDYRALVSVARGIRGRTICPFGDAVSMAVEAMAVKYEKEILDFLEGNHG